MSIFSFAKDVTTLKYIYGEHLDFLVEKHKVTMEEAMEVMIKIGFEQGLSDKGDFEYWRENEDKD